MAKPSRQKDTFTHAPLLAETGRSVAGLLCDFRDLSGNDVC